MIKRKHKVSRISPTGFYSGSPQKKLTEWCHPAGKLKRPSQPRGKRGKFAKNPTKTNCHNKKCNKEFEMTTQQKCSFTKHNKPVFCCWECMTESRTLALEERKGGSDDEWYESDCTASKGRMIWHNRSRRRKAEATKRRANKIKAIEYLGGQCTDCGVMYSDSCKIVGPIGMGPFDTTSLRFLPAECFDIDHVLRKNKTNVFGAIMKRDFEKWIKPEIDNCKCELVCKNCHIIRTVKTMQTTEYKEEVQKKVLKVWKNQYNS
jgi:hypothetical protein